MESRAILIALPPPSPYPRRPHGPWVITIRIPPFKSTATLPSTDPLWTFLISEKVELRFDFACRVIFDRFNVFIFGDDMATKMSWVTKDEIDFVKTLTLKEKLKYVSALRKRVRWGDINEKELMEWLSEEINREAKLMMEERAKNAV